MTAASSIYIEASPKIPCSHAMNGRKFVFPKRRLLSSSSTTKHLKMFTTFPLPQSSMSLPDCIGDKLLQSHHGKRRYQRRGSRCPSMLLLHVSDVLEEAERTVQQNAHAIPQTSNFSPPKQLTSTVTSVERSSFVAENIPVDADSRRHHDQMAVILLTEALQLSTFDSPDQRPMQTS